ncbi:MAG: methyl-accepting chemotaxis protein, partial [Bdellovibrionales bacterium]|nr:methyl-accepting chemotaxis protein [Bdellovibrionales bacterium]
MSWLNKLSLKTRIIVSVNLVLILFGGITFGLLQNFKAKYTEETYNNYFSYAASINYYIEDQFFERYGDVQAFAVNEDVKALNKSKLNADLDQYVSLYGLYDVILVTDKEGNYVASNTKDVAGNQIRTDVLSKLNFSQTPWFKKVISGEFSEEKSKGFVGTYFEDMQMDPIRKLAQGSDQIGTSFSAAIKNDKGEIVGVITNRSSNKWIEDSIKRAYEVLKEDGLDHSEITLLDKNGFILIDHDPSDQNDSNEIKYDLEKVTFKLNLAEGHVNAAEELVKGNDGVGDSIHTRKKIVLVSGYKKIKGSKILDSIGWGVMVRGEKAEVFAHINNFFNAFYLVFSISLIAGFLAAYFFGTQVANSIIKITNLLSTNAEGLNTTSNTLTAQSTRLSESSTEQASAIQETMAAVDEISATVEKNAEAARQSKSVSGDSLQSSNVGKQTVTNMLSSIDEISQSNDSIADQMKQNNEKINEIVKLISDIGNKTKIIN